MQTKPLVPAQVALIQQIINSIEQADADMQFALGAGDQCYALHNKLADVVDELEQLLA